MKTPLKLIALSSAAAVLSANAFAQVNEVQTVAPNVFFHQGEITKKGHCNNGWIILEDYVVVIDANFPSGAKEVIPKIKALTQKPIRFTFDTHHHGDHAYANQLWHEAGSTPVAHLGAVTEMRKYERSLFPEATMDRWNDAAKNRKDVAESKLKAPTLLFSKDMVFDDGKIRVELLTSASRTPTETDLRGSRTRASSSPVMPA
jgi:glyoxylase-like metal-dependent hydrolase (beta-lactamase superfamily II)